MYELTYEGSFVTALEILETGFPDAKIHKIKHEDGIWRVWFNV